MRLKLVVAYDGTGFEGWQSQPSGHTAQDFLESAFAKITGSPVTVHGAGRTDAGVHALGQVAHADIAPKLPTSQWPRALNAHLPPSIRVTRATRVPDSFHARFSATGKVYRYRIWNAPVANPLEANRAWHVHEPLEREKLAAAFAPFVGYHDFAAFSAKRSKKPEDTRRRIERIRIKKSGALWTIDVEGEGFLYKMVRMLVAAGVRCAIGRMSVEEITARLAAAGPRSHHVAPAAGLCLVRVRYSKSAVF